MRRGSQAEAARRDFTLLIDEFQNFTTRAFSSILSEARKFRLSLVLSHQFTSQLEPEVCDAVFGNVGTIIAFQLGSADAEMMAKEYGETFAQSQFVDLERFQILVKASAADGYWQPFPGKTEWCFQKATAMRGAIIHMSRQRYSTVREKVEDKIRRWMESH